MSLFRRRRREDDDPADAEPQPDDEPGPADEAGTEPGEDATGAGDAEPAPDRSAGPFDVSEVDDAVQRIDLGALRVPARAGTELRLELEEGTKRVVAATVVAQGSTLQLQAFAAPRSEGVWAEIRGDIAVQVGKQGGSTQEVAGPFGTELLARVPARTADGRTGHRPARFVGVDGPRWFLRGVISGAAAVEPAAAAPLEEMLRGTVVVRGSEAMAPRDLLALSLPANATPMPRPDQTGGDQTGGDQTGGEQTGGEQTGGEQADEDAAVAGEARAPESPATEPATAEPPTAEPPTAEPPATGAGGPETTERR